MRRRLNPDAPESAYVGIVHRLDRPVSGVLIWAKNPKAARRLAIQFEKRQVIKEYWAIVEVDAADVAVLDRPGRSPIFPSVEDVWEDWLIPADSSGVVRSVQAGDDPGASGVDPRFERPGAILARRLPLAAALARDRPDAPVAGASGDAGNTHLG